MIRGGGVALVALVALAGACRGGSAPTGTATSPAARVRAGLDAAKIALTEVGRLEQPLAMAWCPGDGSPYVAEKGGRVRRLDGAVALDLSRRVSRGGEQGLLGIACGRDGELYASYTDRAGDSQLDQFGRDAGGHIDPAGAHLLVTEQPAPNHNGGNIAFGPDGLLWYGLGDGGGGDDQFHHAQVTGDRLGSIMRLQPANPVPEIMVKGVRNPWRWSFDRTTGDLWIGDVGQDRIEEIDELPAGHIQGANLGWPALEGTERHRRDVAPPPGAVGPVFEYDHGEGQSVVGGFVYRGTAIPALRGAYMFADTYTAQLRAIVVDGAKGVAHRVLGPVPRGLVSSFAEDPAGELYVLSLGGGVYRIDPA